jgi:FkbM family methyltransferase
MSRHYSRPLLLLFENRLSSEVFMRRRAVILSRIGNWVGKPPGFERVMHFLVPPEKCASLPEECVLREGSLFVTRLHLPIEWHIRLFGSYEPELREIMRTVLAPQAVAIDVGANTGWHTLLMARLVGPHGRVLAIEPNPSVRENLARNTRLNQLTQVEIIGCAFGETPGTLDFLALDANDSASASAHVVWTDNARSGAIRVDASTLDGVAAERQLSRIDLIKIDAEGYEWPILQGAEKSIARFHPPIVFEFDETYAVRGKETPALLCAFFRRYGYRLFSVGRKCVELIDERSWPQNANIFAKPVRSTS